MQDCTKPIHSSLRAPARVALCLPTPRFPACGALSCPSPRMGREERCHGRSPAAALLFSWLLTHEGPPLGAASILHPPSPSGTIRPGTRPSTASPGGARAHCAMHSTARAPQLPEERARGERGKGRVGKGDGEEGGPPAASAPTLQTPCRAPPARASAALREGSGAQPVWAQQPICGSRRRGRMGGGVTATALHPPQPPCSPPPDSPLPPPNFGSPRPPSRAQQDLPPQPSACRPLHTPPRSSRRAAHPSCRGRPRRPLQASPPPRRSISLAPAPSLPPSPPPLTTHHASSPTPHSCFTGGEWRNCQS